MECRRDVVEHASQKWPVHQRRSRVNFSREIEMDSLERVKRMPMSGAPLARTPHQTPFHAFLVVNCSHHLLQGDKSVRRRHLSIDIPVSPHLIHCAFVTLCCVAVYAGLLSEVACLKDDSCSLCCTIPGTATRRTYNMSDDIYISYRVIG